MMDTVQDIATALVDDFALRNVAAKVVFGNWQVAQHAGADRVIIGLGAFDPDSQDYPIGAAPGSVVNGETAAAVVAVQSQEVLVWVHGTAPDDTAAEDIPAAAHARTQRLLHATIAGLRRILGRGALGFGSGDWPSADTGDVTYGALATLSFSVAIPVLGDAYLVVPKPYTMTATVKADLPSGEVTAATATVETQ